MKVKTLFVSVLTILLTLANLAWGSTLTVCKQPYGVATRELAFSKLAPLVETMQQRIPDGDNALYVVNLPLNFRNSPLFDSALETATLEVALSHPELGPVIEKVAEQLGVLPNSPEVREALLRLLPRETAEDRIGLIFLYSKNPEVLRFGGKNFATEKGVVLEGEMKDVDAFLTMGGEQERAWWKDTLSKASALNAIGFDPPPEIRQVFGKKPILKIGTWEQATTKLSTIRELVDVSPSSGFVINLFPRTPEQSAPWGFASDKAILYAENGKMLSQEAGKLGYNVLEGDSFRTKEDLLAKIQDFANAGKKVLIYAESAVVDGNVITRIPGLEDTIKQSDFSRFGENVTNSILLVSCNSNRISPNLALTHVGTIHTDEALAFARLTFAGGERDSMASYFEAGKGMAGSWIEATVSALDGVASFLRVTGKDAASTAGKMSREIAQVYKVKFDPTTVPAAPSASAPSAGDAADSQQVSPPPDGLPKRPFSTLAIFLIGLLGASSRELFRWKRLFAQGKQSRYLRPPYIVISLLLGVAAALAALVFASLAPSSALQGAAAFVVGAGFEKIVQLAAKLKIWIPSVPMGGTTRESPAGNDDEQQSASQISIINYLRH